MFKDYMTLTVTHNTVMAFEFKFLRINLIAFIVVQEQTSWTCRIESGTLHLELISIKGYNISFA